MVSIVQMEKVAELLKEGYTRAPDIEEEAAAEFGGLICMSGPSYLRKPDGVGAVVVDGFGEVKDYISKQPELLSPEQKTAILNLFAESVRAEFTGDVDRFEKAQNQAIATGVTEEALEGATKDYESFSAVFGANAFPEDLVLIMKNLDSTVGAFGYPGKYSSFYPKPK